MLRLRRPPRALFLLTPLLLSAAFVVASRAANRDADPPVQAAAVAAGAAFQNHALVPGIAGDDASGDQSQPTATPTVSPTPSPTPTPQSIPGGSLLTMEAGTGLIFSPFHLGSGDRDVWWNGGEFVPDAQEEMQSLGVFASAASLPTEPPVDGYGWMPFVPSAGELFVLRFPDREQDGYTAHAFIWVSTAYKNVAGGHPITFSYKYFPGEPCGGAHATVTALDKTGPPETVVVTGHGDMSGWVLESQKHEVGSQIFSFPDGFILDGSVTIYSQWSQAETPPGDLFWFALPMWDDNVSDDALLRNCEGTLVSTFDDGQ